MKENNICAVDYAFRRVGGKYKGRILWHLNVHKILRYGQLNKKLKDITPKMLTQSLRELEKDNLVHREVYKEVPPKVEYALTETGKELIPFIKYLKDWGEKEIERKGSK